MGIGLAVGKPFTLTYAKAATPEVLWSSPDFSAGNKGLSAGLLIGFAVMTVSSVVGAFFEPTSTVALVCNWVVPVVIMILIVRWQRRQIALMRLAGGKSAEERAGRTIPEGGPVVDFLEGASGRERGAQLGVAVGVDQVLAALSPT